MPANPDNRKTEILMSANDRRTALVTGASRGIGRASAIALARAGFDVAVSARTLVDGAGRDMYDPDLKIPGGLDTAVAAIEAEGQQGAAFVMDLLDRASVEACIDGALEHFGHIDVLVNNAIYQGKVSMTPFLDLDESEVHRLFEGNVFAQMAATGRVLAAMRKRGSGTIVNMISASAYTDPPGPIGRGGWGMAYAMSKGAFGRMTPHLHVEHGPEGIRCFSIDPGYVITEAARARNTAGSFPYPGGEPATIGAVVAWLATSPDADEHLGGIVYAQSEFKKRGLAS